MRVVLLFLLAMAVLALLGRLRFPTLKRPGAPPPLPAPVVCIRCGTPIPGKGPCACGAPRPPGSQGSA